MGRNHLSEAHGNINIFVCCCGGFLLHGSEDQRGDQKTHSSSCLLGKQKQLITSCLQELNEKRWKLFLMLLSKSQWWWHQSKERRTCFFNCLYRHEGMSVWAGTRQTLGIQQCQTTMERQTHYCIFPLEAAGKISGVWKQEPHMFGAYLTI